ncbi:hypothetical protein [Actinocatenispora sera]|uniref:Uncharacterized protein n=1 Tax=Actinocatenispora sera TaxID=390989 RepID=A0A810L6H5_9ACTN|nr:hypothetical protein [Actinocatenispora sera]BCJ30232.1 hypothetical protein Asera_43400 [Actinocatenispora sera]
MRGEVVDTTVPASSPAPPSPTPLVRRAGFWLVVVAAGYSVAMLVLVAPHLPLGADESLYATQVSPRVPALTWTAARARGMTYLIAPIVQVTDSVVALRSYLAVLAGAALTAAYWPWLRALRRPGTVPVAAALFAGLWTTLLYGAEDLPNAWVAFAAVAATGWFARYGQHPARIASESGGSPGTSLDAGSRRSPGDRLVAGSGRPSDRRALIGVAVGLAAIALLRPSDAAWVALPLLATMALVRRWRRPGPLLAVAGGCLAGAAEWIVEAHLRYGGLAARLHEASRQQGGLGWHPIGVLYQLRALNGPLLCRPCSLHHLAAPHAWLLRAWWLAIPVLVVAALVVARRQRRFAAIALPTAVGASIALSYLLTIGYAAPRFLLPGYGLAALPVASVLVAAMSAAHRGRMALLATLVLLCVLHEAAQLATLHRVAHRTDVAAAGAAELRRLGIHRPCVLVGVRRTQMAYRLGCTTTNPAGMPGYVGRQQVVFLTWHPDDRRAGLDWRRYPMPRPGHARHWYAFVAPAP